MRYVGLDLGTSFIKGAVLDLETLAVGTPRRIACPKALSGPSPLRIEYDAEGFVDVTRRLIHELIDEAPDCEGLALSGQMGGLVLVSSNGNPESNYISW